MAELPDVQEIKEILTVVEARDPSTTTVEQFDRDHEILLDTQAEIADAETSPLPAEYPYSRDDLIALLGRVQAAIERNRAKRSAAHAR